jgi:predicted sulfurtransferase
LIVRRLCNALCLLRLSDFAHGSGPVRRLQLERTTFVPVAFYQRSAQTRPITAQSPKVATNPSDSARRITAEELHKLWEKNEVLIVDTRNEPSFKQSRIKGAILIPANEFATRSSELPRDKMIVTYCT